MSSPLSKPRRGGQPGNRNALKHGYYSQAFKKVDLENSESIPIFDLKEEIIMLRIYIRRVLAMAGESDSFVECVGLLRILSLAFTTLTRLISTQLVVSGPNDEFGREVDQAIEELFGDRPLFKENNDFESQQYHSDDQQNDPSDPIFDPADPVI